jgi:hypothetical protein
MWIYLYVCIYVFIYICRVYVCIYTYVCMYVFMCVCVFVCVCAFLMKKSLQPLFSLSGLPIFNSQPQVSVSSCLSRNTKKADEVWIYAGITLRRWLSDVRVMRFPFFCDNIKYNALLRQSKRYFEGHVGNKGLCWQLEIVWLDKSCYVHWVSLHLPRCGSFWRKLPKLWKIMKLYIWSIISVALFREAKPCHLVRSNMFWSCLVPSATWSWSPRR